MWLQRLLELVLKNCWLVPPPRKQRHFQIQAPECIRIGLMFPHVDLTDFPYFVKLDVCNVELWKSALEVLLGFSFIHNYK